MYMHSMSTIRIMILRILRIINTFCNSFFKKNGLTVYNLHLYNFYNLFCTEYSIHVWNPCRWPRVNQVLKEKFKNFNFSPLHNNSPVNGKMSSSSCGTVFFNFYVQCKTCTNSYSFGGIHCTVHIWCVQGGLPWRLTFAPGQLENLRFFYKSLCRAPWILQIQSTEHP